jgi:hypothetical protein
MSQKSKFGYELFALSKMATGEGGGKGRDFKKNRNCEVSFSLQKQ